MGRKKAKKAERKASVATISEPSKQSEEAISHTPDAKWITDKDGNIEMHHIACGEKQTMQIKGMDKRHFNVWKMVPRFCTFCDKRIKYVQYNGKIVELDEKVTNLIW